MSEERESKMWWVVTEGAVVESKGFTCAPMNPGTWWFPWLGFSSHEGVHVLAEKKLAVAKCRVELLEKRRAIDEQLRKLEAP